MNHEWWWLIATLLWGSGAAMLLAWLSWRFWVWREGGSLEPLERAFGRMVALSIAILAAGGMLAESRLWLRLLWGVLVVVSCGMMFWRAESSRV